MLRSERKYNNNYCYLKKKNVQVPNTDTKNQKKIIKYNPKSKRFDEIGMETQLVTEFVSKTGASPNDALSCLKTWGWDLKKALIDYNGN